MFTTGVISAMGYGGVVLLMAIESACIPLPSEIIMPFAGYLVYTGEFTLHGAALAGAVGCVVGSIPAYYLGMFGGRPIIERCGPYVLRLPAASSTSPTGSSRRHGQWVVLAGPPPPGHPHLHRLPGRRGADEHDEVHRLHLRRLVSRGATA